MTRCQDVPTLAAMTKPPFLGPSETPPSDPLHVGKLFVGDRHVADIADVQIGEPLAHPQSAPALVPVDDGIPWQAQRPLPTPEVLTFSPFRVPQPTTSCVQFMGQRDGLCFTLLRLHGDGRAELGEGITGDEAAKECLRLIVQQWGSYLLGSAGVDGAVGAMLALDEDAFMQALAKLKEKRCMDCGAKNPDCWCSYESTRD